MNRRTLLQSLLAMPLALMGFKPAAVRCTDVKARHDERWWHYTIAFSDGTEISYSTTAGGPFPIGFVGRPKSDFAFSVAEWKAFA